MTIKKDQQGLVVQAARPSIYTQQVFVGGGSTQSTAMQTGPTNQYTDTGTPLDRATPRVQNTNHVRLVANTNCWVAFGSNPTAATQTAGSIYLPANTPEYFWVYPGDIIAVIQDTASGWLNIAELVN